MRIRSKPLTPRSLYWRYRSAQPDNSAHPLSIHMGLNSEFALVGSTRFEGLHGSRWTFTASGSVTNLAARLAGIAEAGKSWLVQKPCAAWAIATVAPWS